ncbi:MMPL family transporter [Flaviflexus equikiangi]|uniref:MMPL family transporter n=1 Tax=Flaviflexus equikiangi TaxID=2758573 RepID=A0ABS2THA1_9ACTO|nr:MMPL family transporter [Flaviflexus equikiangi]MBM9432911.1 MMPL family transporter [Flaviflexus equikiangi]
MGSREGRGGRWWARVLLPALIILTWLTMAGLGGPLFGRIEEVSSNDQNAYLPQDSESAEVAGLVSDFYDSDDIPGVVVVVSDNGALVDSDLDAIASATEAVAGLEGVGDISPPIPSEDGEAVQIFVPLDSSGEITESVEQVRATLADELPDSLTAFVTGPAGLTADLSEAFGGIDGLLLGVAFLAVLLILLVVYRSFVLPAAVLTTSLLALSASILVIWNLANWDIFLLNGQTQGILFILVIGAATDYSLLYVSRYREELLQHEDKWVATRKAWRGTIEPVLASGGTVIAGLLCLLLSNLESNSVLGPVASVGIIFAMLSALTLLPAMLGLAGRKAFWPRVPKFDEGSEGHEHINFDGVWGRTVRFVERRSRIIWILTTVALAIGAFGAFSLKADGVAQTDFVLTASEARDGQEKLSEHFPAGSGSPASVLVNESDIDVVVAALYENDGIDSVTIFASDAPSGQAPITTDGITAVGPPGTPAPEPTVVDGRVLLQATLTDPADSTDAFSTIEELRETMVDVAPDTLIGGTTATNLDTITTSIADRNLIIPIILVVILLILMMLLRAVVAPILLILTTILSFGTAMGVAAVVFNNILDFPGADPSVPLYSFVFLVALGIDYNIFLMTRVREETIKYGTHEGVVRGLAITGTVITSAGVVLAATFAALAVIPILFLFQLAFIVAFGVLLDTFIVRTLLVPALSLDIGKAIWWPSKLAKDDSSRADAAGAEERELVGTR